MAPLPTLDPVIVARSARALERYGPDFTYRHYAAVPHLPVLVAGAAGLAALTVLAQLRPVRDGLSRLHRPGSGPDVARRAASWFTARFHATAGDHEVVTEVSGGDPAYGETSKMLAESALCLALDDLPPAAGQLTTAVAMGQPLIERLRCAGIRFTLLDQAPDGPPERRAAAAE